ncbi:peptidylprolyl isomerase [uncultured Flavonifractor sp.]|uniref:peptidylprolyl isomerase n=1 Tax=uncultured Flavonifractor sp. TaxID=1193534 RepID=UPI00262AE91D|nr:peptidylprolyl isomerase [uncultured Flavonifractor sp.]
MNWKKLLCTGLAGALLLGALAGCASQAPAPTPTATPAATPTGEDVAYRTAGIPADTVLYTADGEEGVADEYLYWLLNAVAQAKSSGYLADDGAWEEEIDGTPTADYLKQAALENAKLYTVAMSRINQAGLTLSQEDQDSIQTQMASMASMLEMYYGVTLQEYLEQQCISQAAYEKMAYEIPMLVTQLQEQYVADGEITPTDENIRAMIDETGIYSCKHILLAFPENEDGSDPTDAQKAEVKGQADALLAQLQAAADPVAAFETAMNEKSQDGRDPETNELYAPQGYTFLADGSMIDGSGSLTASFVEAGVALGEGELSQPVETPYGYHILLGQSADNEDTRAVYPNYAMNQRIDQWMEQAQVETTAAYDALDPKTFYDKVMELAEQWAAEKQAEAEAEAQAEASASPAAETDSPSASEAPAESPAA